MIGQTYWVLRLEPAGSLSRYTPRLVRLGTSVALSASQVCAVSAASSCGSLVMHVHCVLPPNSGYLAHGGQAGQQL